MRQPFAQWIRIMRPRWLILAISVYVVTMGLGSFLILKPPTTKYNEVLNRQVGLDDTYVNLIAFDVESAIGIIESDLEDLKAMRADFEDRLLKEKSHDAVLSAIRRYCSRANLRVSTLQFTDDTLTVHEDYEKRFVGVTLRGRYSDFLRFLEKLESNPEWILIENFAIRNPDGSSISRIDLGLSVLKEMDKT